MKFSYGFLIIFIFLFSTIFLKASSPPSLLNLIHLPPGFQIQIYAENIPGCRQLTVSDNGTVFAGSREGGKVYALPDFNNDFKVDDTIVIASGLNMPNGVAYFQGDLYVAEINQILKFENIDDHLRERAPYEIINNSFPTDEHHGWKYIKFGPDGWLYIPVGAPCNACDRPDDERYASIMRMKPDGSLIEMVAKGIRNTVGFDWHPQTKELWFTDNGRDWLGQDSPPDELNRVYAKNLNFGFPFCHGKNIADPLLGSPEKSCDHFVPPALELSPHVAALGMKFYTGKMFPEKFKNNIFIAEHGSWNRMQPIGYRITFVKLEGNSPVSYEIFADGWLQGQSAWGRPVDILEMADGSILVSDDKMGKIYRITYQNK